MNIKDPKIIALFIVILVIIGGGIFFIAGKKNTPAETITESDETVIEKLTKEELDLSLEVSPDNKKIKLLIGNASDIKHIDYEITMDTDSTEEEGIVVPQAITGEEDIDGSSYETKFLDMGTCSKNVCVTWKGIKNIQLMLKVTKKDGKIYQAEDTASLN